MEAMLKNVSTGGGGAINRWPLYFIDLIFMKYSCVCGRSGSLIETLIVKKREGISLKGTRFTQYSEDVPREGCVSLSRVYSVRNVKLKRFAIRKSATERNGERHDDARTSVAQNRFLKELVRLERDRKDIPCGHAGSHSREIFLFVAWCVPCPVAGQSSVSSDTHLHALHDKMPFLKETAGQHKCEESVGLRGIQATKTGAYDPEWQRKGPEWWEYRTGVVQSHVMKFKIRTPPDN